MVGLQILIEEFFCLGRKLKVPGQNRNEKKRRHNQNEPYTAASGALVEPKTFKVVDKCCKKSCYRKMSETQQQIEFDKFYKSGSYEARCLYLRNSIMFVRSNFPSKKKGLDRKKHSVCRTFYLCNIQFCRKFFLSLLQIGISRVERAIAKIQNLNIQDQRGKSAALNKIPEEKMEHITAFLDQFPTYIVYSNSTLQVKENEWSKKKIYEFYVDYWKKEHVEKEISLMKFYNIFNKYNG